MRYSFTSTYGYTPQFEVSHVASSSLALDPNCAIDDYRKNGGKFTGETFVENLLKEPFSGEFDLNQKA